MEQRREAVGAPPLYYLYPLNTGVNASTGEEVSMLHVRSYLFKSAFPS